MTSSNLPRSIMGKMLSKRLLVSIIFHFFTAFSIIFCPLYIFTGWLFSVEHCFYASVTLLVGSVLALLVFRVRRPTKSELEEFLGSDWPSRNIAHRGGVTEAPENTLAAFREARINGSGFVELDVTLTKDGKPIIIHDDTVDRTTNGTGKIKDFTLAEIIKLNAAAKHPLRDRFPTATIPTLEETTSECLNIGLKIFFDVKDYSEEMLVCLLDLWKRYPKLYTNGIICSFFPQVVYKVRRRDSKILTALTSCPDMVDQTFDGDKGPMWKAFLCAVGDFLLVWSHSAWLWLLCGNGVALIDKDMASQSVVDYWKQHGIRTVVWTVNDQSEKDYFHKSLECGVITNNVIEHV